jgi:hypothetical protein
MMDRETWLRRILEATRDLADEAYQERVWVRGEGPEVDSSTEAICRLVDDYDLAGFVAEAATNAWVSKDQIAALQRLNAKLAQYAAGDQGGQDPARIVTPEWQKIRKLAKATLETFTTRPKARRWAAGPQAREEEGYRIGNAGVAGSNPAAGTTPHTDQVLALPELKLTVTEQIDMQQAQRLATELRRHLQVDGPHPYFRRGDPSTIPQYIQLIGPVAVWLPLLYPAKWFLKPYLETLGPIAAHATRDALAALFKKKEVKPLAEVATTLADARKASGGHVEIVIGLDIPDPHFGTALRIAAHTPEEIAHALAVFVTCASELSTLMKAEVAAGRAPLGRALITLEKDGGLTVRWRCKDFADHEKRIP